MPDSVSDPTEGPELAVASGGPAAADEPEASQARPRDGVSGRLVQLVENMAADARPAGGSPWGLPVPASVDPDGEAAAAPAAAGPVTCGPGAAAFSATAMLHPESPPGSRLRRAVRRLGASSGLGPAAAEQWERDLEQRIRAPLAGCRRIVVLSRKGGVGKTTVTLLLGAALATLRTDRVVALDANPDAGSLAHRVERRTVVSVSDLLAAASAVRRVSDMRAYTIPTPTRLDVLAADDDPRITTALGEREYRAVLEVLERFYDLVLCDTGTGILHAATRGLLHRADQIVLVVPPALDGARTAAATLDWLDEHGHAHLVAGAVAVLNGVRGDGGAVDLDRVEGHFADRCAGCVRIPYDPHLAAGGPVDVRRLDRRTRLAAAEVAAGVADGFDRSPLPSNERGATGC